MSVFEYEMMPRLSETDGLGHINNTVHPIWFEEARRELFSLFIPGLAMESWPLILKKYEVELLNQVFHNEKVLIRTYVEQLGNSSFTVLQEAVQGGRPVSKGRTVLVYFDYQQNKVTRIPEDVREILSAYLAE